MAYNVNFDAGALFKDLNNQIKFALAEALEETARAVQGDWQESIYRQRGMVRMETSSGKQTSSKFFTFRIMAESSPGWIIKAKPGRFIVKGVAGRAQEMLTYNVQGAIAAVAGI